MKNHSPWIHQLDADRQVKHLSSDEETDVVIVGAGIAGISTAFFLLKNTNQNIILVDKFKLAHGATGHNAGQVVTYFERPFKELCAEFGKEMAAKGQKAVEDAWGLMTEMYTDAALNIPFDRFIGFTGYTTLKQVINSLEESRLRKIVGLLPYPTYISHASPFLRQIPEEYKDLYEIVSKNEILERLETCNSDYQAVEAAQKGTINSALFCQEVFSYLSEKYGERIKLYEYAEVNKVVLHEDYGFLDLCKYQIKAKKIVLCTNGFENLKIFEGGTTKLDTSFHDHMNGVVARMSGYLETMNKSPTATSYYVKENNGFDSMDEAYFYLTRRVYEYDQNSKHNLICIGGPQHTIADKEEYLFEFDYPEDVPKEIDEFVRTTYDTTPNKKIEYQFTWHGLMGYTRNRVRVIGPEPRNPILLYNLGCNGIGILPSIFGGKRIADILSGAPVEPMIFDPK